MPRSRRRSSDFLSPAAPFARVAIVLGVLAACGGSACRRNTHHWGRDRKGPSAGSSAPVVEDRVVLPPVPPPEPPPPPPPPPPRRSPPKAGPPSTCGPRGPGVHYVVRGVDSSDVLNVREKPDWKSGTVGSLPPDATGVLGGPTHARKGSAPWRHVTCGKVSGWVNERFLSVETAPAADEP